MPNKDEVCKSESKQVLLVEGVNDCHGVMALCEYHNVPESFGIYECGGDIQLLKRLNALIIQSEPPEIIGIVLDADNPDLIGRWTSLKDKLRHYHYTFPDLPSSGGTIVHSASEVPQLGVWLMPNNQITGMLEDFCAQMIDTKARAVAEQCVGIAQAEGVSTFKPTHYMKAVIRTHLAWQDEPGCPLGQAITRQALRADSEIAVSFVRWIGLLFNNVPE